MAAKNEKFAGMKVSPYINSPKNAIKDKTKGRKRKKKVGNGNVTAKKGLSRYQLRTQEEFMKVRPGETKEQWIFRTRFRRIRTEDELALTVNGQKRLKKIEIVKDRKYKKRLQLRINEKNFDFLKYYIFIINWATTKYNISQFDFELGFHFYENIPFTKEQFINKSLLAGNSAANVFNRFRKDGYIIEIFSIIGNNNMKKTTGMFKLTPKFVRILTAVYEKIAFQSHFDFRSTIDRQIPPELEKMILEMSAENQDIISGKKEPQTIIIHKDTKQ